MHINNERFTARVQSTSHSNNYYTIACEIIFKSLHPPTPPVQTTTSTSKTKGRKGKKKQANENEDETNPNDQDNPDRPTFLTPIPTQDAITVVSGQKLSIKVGNTYRKVVFLFCQQETR